MKLVFTPKGWEHYTWIQETDKQMLKRTNLLIRDVLRTPFEGLGKPEPLKTSLLGFGRAELPKNTV